MRVSHPAYQLVATLVAAAVGLTGCVELPIEVDNSHPDSPLLTVIQSQGVYEAPCLVLVRGSDPDGDELSFTFEIGTEFVTMWSSYYPSDVDILFGLWVEEQGLYQVRARCRDAMNDVSGLSNPVWIEVVGLRSAPHSRTEEMLPNLLSGGRLRVAPVYTAGGNAGKSTNGKEARIGLQPR